MTKPHTPPGARQMQSASQKPLVSISCTAYNHEKYIAQAMDSFLQQEMSFPIEILVHDDASTDKTADIIRAYAEERPDIIKPIIQTENQFSKGKRPAPQINYPRAEGKYIAVCEGDDYWTDPLKLQKQVEYLEANPAVFLCAHAVRQINDAGAMLADSKFGIDEDQYVTRDELAFGNLEFPTLSVMFRNTVQIPEFRILNGDTFTFAFFSNFGDAYVASDAMGVHRVHEHGIWSSLSTRARYDATLRTWSAIPAVIDSPRKAIACLRYLLVAARDYSLARKIRTVPIASLMTLVSLRPHSLRFILGRLFNRGK